MPEHNRRYNLMELMVTVAARQLENGKTAVIGTGMPLAAAMLAQPDYTFRSRQRGAATGEIAALGRRFLHPNRRAHAPDHE